MGNYNGTTNNFNTTVLLHRNVILCRCYNEKNIILYNIIKARMFMALLKNTCKYDTIKCIFHLKHIQ